MSDRKRRSDAFDAPLSESERAGVYAAMNESWVAAQKLCADAYGLQVGKTALYEFARDYRESESERRIQDALAFQIQTRRAVDQIGDMDPEMAAGWEQLALEASLSGNVELATQYLGLAEKLHSRALERAKLELKKEAQDKSWEELKLSREKYEDQKAKNEKARDALEGVKAKGGIDEETLRKIEEAVGLL